MAYEVVNVARNGLYISLFRGFVMVKEKKVEIGRVPISLVNSVIFTARGSTISTPTLSRLANQNIPVIFCGENYHPISICLPTSYNKSVGQIVSMQALSGDSIKGKIWKNIVIQKIKNQAGTLLVCAQGKTKGVKHLEFLTTKVLLKDKTNQEAVAARFYWHELFGKKFKRTRRSSGGLNSALNYGYSVIRAAMARSLVAAGLNPSLGVFHSGDRNPFCLVDDLMEIYRPFVDLLVYRYAFSGRGVISNDLNTDLKKTLSAVLLMDVSVDAVVKPLVRSMDDLSRLLIKSLREKSVLLPLIEHI